ncbi:septation protein SepH [Geodermatophilus sp. SYSU D00815]
MRRLRLVALSDDGKSLILTAEAADGSEELERFELPIDERVRAAARGDARLGAIEDLGNTLPPRVIQARIRAGETPEQVAEASGTRVERIMRFAHPVLQERARVAEQAREARVRLSEGTTNTSLDRFMAGRLRLIGGDPDAVRWDAYRADDGSWVVAAGWKAGGKSGTTLWSYDIPARTVTPLDAATMDFAEGTRLVRVVPDVPGGVVAPAPNARPVAVVQEEPAEDDEPAPEAPEPEPEHVRDVAPPDGTPGSGDPFADDPELAEHDTVVLGRTGEEPEDPRARIPAWEDIVFGVRRHR